jgi:hypothetical protein
MEIQRQAALEATAEADQSFDNWHCQIQNKKSMLPF